MLCPRASSDTRAEPQCEPGDSLLAEVQPEDYLHEEGIPVKDGLGSRARLVYRGCHRFIINRSGRVLKATEDQTISTR